ncbi:hypothetical protein DY000_02020389 [Brassica cretica]|uniref:Uncharacterized protein n=1 Tax=Brassica cretica TaxID=69181 RepID=A0ABQ7EJL9_BRACR|nr:hypothetical protein DY000_02020389 [Brassica cretica]
MALQPNTLMDLIHDHRLFLPLAMLHSLVFAGFEDCRTGPPREPRYGRSDASWNKSWNELERTRAEARAGTERERLRAGADRMNTSWNACKNRLGFVGFGLGFQSISARTVSVREGASVVRLTNGLH